MLTEHVAGVLEHKRRVAHYLLQVIEQLQRRAIVHDDSKFSAEEIEAFEEATPLLKTLTYGSEEYKAALHSIKPALEHHYAQNSHHPEHFTQGIAGMTLLDVVEMLCDWQAACERTKDGDIRTSLEINKKRFGIDDQLYSILKNTLEAQETQS